MATNGRPGPKLSTKQRRFLAGLLTAQTIAEAAELAGCGERTAYRWLRSEPVRSALSEALDIALSQAAAKAAGAMGSAVEVLLAIAQDITAPASARVSAARAILQNGVAMRESLELSERVAALEAHIGGAK